MNRILRLGLLCLLPLCTCFGGTPPPDATAQPEALQKNAVALEKAGQFKEALEIFRFLGTNNTFSGNVPVAALEHGFNSLQQLNLIIEQDAFMESVAAAHPTDWRVLRSAALLYRRLNHSGYLIGGQFTRGWHRGGGQWVNVDERDQIRALQLLEQARLVGELLPNKSEFAIVLLDYASVLQGNRTSPSQSWRLQVKTDITTLPDWSDAPSQDSATSGAPVDEQGNPVLYALPTTFDTATNDGERIRWLLAEAARCDPSRELDILLRRANFLQEQFGAETLAGQSFFFRMPDENPDTAAQLFDLYTLGENEALARLATGVKRFPLPDEHNPIALFRRVAAEAARVHPQSHEGQDALERLAAIFENRRQYEKAAACWKENILRYGPGTNNYKQQRLDQILGSWGSFEPLSPQTAAGKPSFDFLYRNGNKATFEARAIDVARLLQDIRDYLKNNPRELDWEKLQIENLGWRLVQTNESRYIGKTVAQWSASLTPREAHFDRRITVQAPLTNSGAYWITSRMANGNTNHIVLWVQDAVLVQKPMSDSVLLFAADAETGAPLSGAAISAFGYRTEWKNAPAGIQGRHDVVTRSETGETSEDGLWLPERKQMPQDYQWLCTASTRGGRFAFLGFAPIWFPSAEDSARRDTRTYIMTDRPVYRPGQSVRFKAWISPVSYDLPAESPYAGHRFTVRITDARNNKVLQTNCTADAFGGIDGCLALGDEAALGSYSIEVVDLGSSRFRVEEYKKPEFEVTVEAPADPIALGDAFKAKLKARYYFGAPVTKARVSWKVIRSTYTVNWFPPGPWDWLYGNGYGWLAPDYAWYPGWSRWGCLRPAPWWRPTPFTQPEVIAENTVEIGPEGTLEIPVDSAVAKAMFGNQDHEYSITAEVTDASRRTIVGTGRVIAAREPFKLYAWTHRGFYRAGDTIRASFSARRPDGKPVSGTGVVRLLKLSYKAGKPDETAVQEWPVEFDEDGDSRLQFVAAAAGQYRLSATLSRQSNRSAGHVQAASVEGACLVTVRGEGFSGSGFRFNAVEIIPDKATYAPGEKASLLLQADRANGTVLLFTRPANGSYQEPEVIRLTGQSTLREIEVEKGDMPNFFVEVLSVQGGRVHTETREILVPPEQRVLNITVEPAMETSLPGATNRVIVRATTLDGKPAKASLVLTVYDKAVEYISGGSNVPEIKEFFWKWRRHHNPTTLSSADRFSAPVVAPNTEPMANLGMFGESVADEDGSGAFGDRTLAKAMPRRRGAGKVSEMVAPAAASFAADGAFGMESRSGMDAESPAEAPVTVRKEFADTAFWADSLTTDENGLAEVSFPMPENLGEWTARSWAFGPGARVGENRAKIVTSKNLLVRLQAPRFFVEKDEVVLSAIIHNALPTYKNVRAVLELDGGTLEPIDKTEARLRVEAGGEARVDWRVKAVKEGTAIVRMKALSDTESDAMQMDFPVYVHGMLKTESWSGAIRNGTDSASLEVLIPTERRPAQTLLEVRWSPTLAGAMVDALPYLAAYPYGCTEQTLNRFLPSVITRRILEQSGLDLEAIRTKQTNLNAQERGDPQKRAEGWKRFPDNPVFDRAELDKMVRNGVARLADMQNGDGGWNWFPGWKGESSAHLTAQIVHGFHIARACGVAVPDSSLQRAIEWLNQYALKQIRLLQDADEKKKNAWKTQADNLDALVYCTLVEIGQDPEALRDFLYRDRTSLSLYGQGLLGLALEKKGRKAELEMVLKNIGQFVEQDEENQTVWLRMNNNGYWWHWFGDEIEAHAVYLKLLTRTDPKGPLASRLVKYLLNNRKHSTYWNSTRDTAQCVEAMADFITASGEGKPDMTVEVWMDGNRVAEPVRVTADNLFAFDNTVRLEGATLSNGAHKLEVRRSGSGPVYFNAYLENFTLEDPIAKAGLEVKVQRRLYKLVEADKTAKAGGAQGQAVDVRVDRYVRQELKSDDTLKSGDLVEVELLVESKNDYEYLVIEDMKAAGFEAVEVRSGYTDNAMGAYMEFRDERVCLFLRTLARGNHSVSYRVRAEIPGQFSVLPAKISGMYAPELRGNSDEQKIGIRD
jgi:uncharacterized protein YfaS (alpha-2-macroglobulin family)